MDYKYILYQPGSVAENFPDVVRGCKMAINHMMEAKGFSSEINYAFHANSITRGFGLRSDRAAEAGIRGETRRERRVGRADVALETSG